ncbi:MAG: hypothetical protein M3P49_17250 [Actinomycetota bacterium]|nr:hypothetical protein [Actinomycetota bacterium]
MLDERRRLGLPELERPPEGAVDPVEHALAVAESVAEEKEFFDEAYLAGDSGPSSTRWRVRHPLPRASR